MVCCCAQRHLSPCPASPFGKKRATAPEVALHDKSAVAPDGKDIELVITDGRVTGGSVPDGVYRLSGGRLVTIKSNRIAATANR